MIKHNQQIDRFITRIVSRSNRIRMAWYVALTIFTTVVVQGATFTFKSGKFDFTKAENYTVGEVQATVRPGADDEVIVPAGTYSLPGSSDSFKVLSGVKRVKPNEGAIFEITVAENGTCTFNAPINYNGGFAYNNASVRCYGKVIKKGRGTLILAASGRTKSTADNTNFNKIIDITPIGRKGYNAIKNDLLNEKDKINGYKQVAEEKLDDVKKLANEQIDILSNYSKQIDYLYQDLLKVCETSPNAKIKAIGEEIREKKNNFDLEIKVCYEEKHNELAEKVENAKYDMETILKEINELKEKVYGEETKDN